MEEIYKEIPGYEKYHVSNFGILKTDKRIIKPRQQGAGYNYIVLCKNGSRKEMAIHRIVAILFVDNPNNLSIVNHIDHDKKNNRADNLEWTTHQINIKKAFLRDETNVKNFLGDNPKETIKQLKDTGMSIKDISIMLKCSTVNIYKHLKC